MELLAILKITLITCLLVHLVQWCRVLFAFFAARTESKRVPYVSLISTLVEFYEAYRHFAPEAEILMDKQQDVFVREVLDIVLRGNLAKRSTFKALRNLGDSLVHHYLLCALGLRAMMRKLPALCFVASVPLMIFTFEYGGFKGSDRLFAPIIFALALYVYTYAVNNFMIRFLQQKLLAMAKAQQMKNAVVLDGAKCMYRGAPISDLLRELNTRLPKAEPVTWAEVARHQDAEAV